MSETAWKLNKRLTGIAGLDSMTGGGLPASQATLVLGDTGTGKTVLMLQILAHAINTGDGGLFVTFEESREQVRRNADSFRWGAALSDSKAWSMIDARAHHSAESAGQFDIEGLLVAIEVQARQFRNPWVVIDGIDQLLKHQPDQRVAVDQVRQINERCERGGWTMLLSGKLRNRALTPRHLEGIEFMLPTVLLLSAEVIERRLHRHLHVAKYRGSGHVTDEVPLILNDDGIHLPCRTASSEIGSTPASIERISTGIKRLDTLLGGGPYRGSSILISGRPGTTKSTLAAAFAEAAALRGERALYLSFDEREAAFVRNLASVGIRLQPHIDAGRLKFSSRSAASCLVTEHMLVIQRLIEEFKPDCLVIDPISGLFKSSGGEDSRSAIEGMLNLATELGITTLLTSLTIENDPEGESTLALVSTIADTWIVLEHNVRAGERNRSLSIVKSRGSDHSNQQRELLLSSEGIDLADVYEYGTEVLMGTARAQKQAEVREASRRLAVQQTQRRLDLERRIEQTRIEVERLTAELQLEEREIMESDRMKESDAAKIRQRRDSDCEPDNEGKDQ